MTSQRLYEILKIIDALDRKLKVQDYLEAIRDALKSLASSPAQPNFQASLASALSSFSDATTKMGASITPSQSSAIREMGGEDFFDSAISENVRDAVQTNAMTPAVARDFVADLTSRRAEFLETVRSAYQSLEKLGVTASGLKPGMADVSFLIPRDIFDNQVGPFAKELKFINRLVEHYAEAQTGKTEPVILEQLSSSLPTVAIVANLAALSLLGTVINKFLDAWIKVERIRKSRADLADMGLKGKALEELDERITTTVKEVVDESTELVIANYPGTSGRKSELANAIRGDTKRLFAQIERGLTVEFRAQPNAEDGDVEDEKNLKQIAETGRVLKFPKVANEPLLLDKGKILGDEQENDDGSVQVVKHTKRTATRRTTTIKAVEAEHEKKD